MLPQIYLIFEGLYTCVSVIHLACGKVCSAFHSACSFSVYTLHELYRAFSTSIPVAKHFVCFLSIFSVVVLSNDSTPALNHD